MTRISHPDPGFRLLAAKISRERGFACSSYKERCLQRRIGVRLRARGVHTYEAYARVLDTDETEYDRLLDALTINVTKLFRNREVFDAVARSVIPALWEWDTATIRAWSAGTASGEEAYTLAILFHRHAASLGEVDGMARVRVLGTDIDRESLAAAERGAYQPAAFADTTDDIARRYFTGGDTRAVIPEIADRVTFAKHDLLRDPPPLGMHLIVCRNVIIYFDREAQEALLETLHEALTPGGYLVLGKVESLIGPARKLFRAVNARERVYQRV